MMHLPDPPNLEQIESKLKNIFYSCYDAYCDMVNKKIDPWTAILIGYNLGKMRFDKDKIGHYITLEKIEPCKCCGK
jgi:hypothetical protein